MMNVNIYEKSASVNSIISGLNEDGAVIIENLLSENDLSQLTQDSQQLLNKTENCNGYFFGLKTKRVGTMIRKSPICQKMAMHPTILSIMDYFLLPHCSEYQLNLSQLISIGPGEAQQAIHRDDPMFPFDHTPSMQVMINVMWAIDDFTQSNGATHIVPKSHLWNSTRYPEANEDMQATMKKGSCLIWLGSAHHGGGANESDRARRGVVMSYNLGWLKSSENYFLSIPLDEIETYPERLQRLLGFFVHRPNVNTVEGRDPIELIQKQGHEDSPPVFKEYLTDEVQELLDSYYAQEI
jgi:ectoine hydroxylase-related dioxygenase (phytanoyl-CoA dioxygenase family)